MQTYRQAHLAVFERTPVERVVWQPRLEHWINTHRRQGTLPDRYREMSDLEIYDDLGCSVRGYHLFNPCFRQVHHPDYVSTARDEGDFIHVTWTTPAGTLTLVEQRTDLSHLTRDFPVKRVEDLAVIEWILTHRRWEYDADRFARADAEMGDRGAPTIYVSRCSIMRMIIEWLGLERTIYFLADYPKEMEHLIRTIEETDDPLYDLVAKSPIRIVNHGDNVHSDLLPPTLMRTWIMPHYQRRAAQMHAVGKWTFPHWDGYVKPLLPLARECGFDGIEAVTPEPQGDVTLEYAKEQMGDLILLDGIPAIYFLPDYPVELLVECTRRCLELFWPNLILGISDEISPPGDIERVRLVSELVAGWRP